MKLIDFINSLEFPVVFLVDGPGGSGDNTAFFGEQPEWLEPYFDLAGEVAEDTWEWDGEGDGRNYLRILTCSNHESLWKEQREDWEMAA
jgi:hypothetical protein